MCLLSLVGFVLQEVTCPDMLLTPGEWPTRGGGGLMVSDVLQIGCERLAHTSQELSRSFTAVTARSCRPPRTGCGCCSKKNICCWCVFIFSHLSSTSATCHFILHPPPPSTLPIRPLSTSSVICAHVLLRYFGMRSSCDYGLVCIFDKSADDRRLCRNVKLATGIS